MDILPHVINSVLFVIVMALFARLSRSRYYRHEPVITRSIESLAQEYGHWEKRFNLLSVAAMIPACALAWYALNVLGLMQRRQLGEASFVFTPTPIVWIVPAILLGILADGFGVDALERRLLGVRRYAEFMEYQSMKYGVNVFKAVAHAALLLITSSAVFVGLALDAYVVASEDRLVIDPFFGLRERTYEWSDVARVSHVKAYTLHDGTIVRDNPYYTLEMRDGTTVNFLESFFEPDLEEQRKFAEFAAETSKSEIEIVDIPPDDAPIESADENPP